MEEDRLERRPEARAFSVEALLQHVRDGKIRIPEFQRPLRWRASDVLDLFDSVYRGFPVGDLLFFKRAADATTVHVGVLHVHAPAVPDAYFVVDGQQRITALASAMLHPEPRPRGDIYAVWFDLEEGRFVRVRDTEPPAQWIPLNVVGDSFALLTWLNEWPFRTQRPDLVQRAIALGKALREYQIPAYIVEGASDQVLRLIFKRVNTSGVRMEETEVFTALFGGNEPHPIETACARLQTAVGVQIRSEWFLRCIKVIEGLDVTRQLTETQVLNLDPLAVERTERALLHVVQFLNDDAGVIHLKLLPYPRPFVVLARYFYVHPRSTQRTRALLARWLWRGALSIEHTNSSDIAMQTDLRLIGKNEFASVERLLWTIPVGSYTHYLYPRASVRWGTGEALLCALAIAHLGPRDPETGEVLGDDAIRALLDQKTPDDVFLDVAGQDESTVARRVLVPTPSALRALPSAPLAVLESHGIDQEAADALGRGDLATFEQRRALVLDRWFQRFFTARTGADDSDRPPVDELIRRVDNALSPA